MIKAVLFDMDGILFDSEAYYMQGAYVWMKQLGYQGAIETLYTTIGKDMKTMYQMFTAMLDDKVPYEVVKKTNEDYFLIDHPMHAKEWMFDGVEEVLKKLKELDIKCAVCSSSDKFEIVKALKQMEIENYFDVVLSVQECALPKPAGDIYETACKRLGLNSHECIVYEDSESGILAGINAGMYTVAREEKRFNLDQSKANRIVKDIDELYKVVMEMRDINGRSH